MSVQHAHGGRDDDPEQSAELRELYRRLQPPAPADDAADADAETARTVQWMQTAWRGLEVPEVRVPHTRAPLVPQRVRRSFERWTLVAAAAVLLVVGGAALWRLRAGSRDSTLAPRVADGSGARGASDVETKDVEVKTAKMKAVEVVAVLPDRLELRSGPVRLVLLEPPHNEAETATDEPTGG